MSDNTVSYVPFILLFLVFLAGITLIAGIFVNLGVVAGFISIICFFALLVFITQASST
jgi:hypothetical protein